MRLVSWAAFFLIIFGVAFVVAALISRRHVSLVAGGFLLAVVCWVLFALFGWYGEGSRDWGEAGAALGAGLITIVSLAVWGVGVVFGYLVGEAFRRQRRRPMPH